MKVVFFHAISGNSMFCGSSIDISDLKIYDAAGSKKEIYRDRQKLWIICGPRGILNGFVTLNTTLN
jgi:hypothetical protein